jgi:hypothetical protein
MGRRKSSLMLFLFTFVLCLPIIYFNKDFAALDIADFYIGTIMIYILASIQIFIYVFKIGVDRGEKEANEGSLIPFPKPIKFVLKYITPWFLFFIFVSFCYMNLPEYLDKMNPEVMGLLAENKGQNVEDAKTKAVIARSVVIGLLIIYGFIYFLVSKALEHKKDKVLT